MYLFIFLINGDSEIFLFQSLLPFLLVHWFVKDFIHFDQSIEVIKNDVLLWRLQQDEKNSSGMCS